MILTALAILLPVSLTAAQAVESSIAPVVKPMLDVVTLEVDGTRTIAYVSFNKVRECSFLAIKWYNKEDERIGLEFRDESEFSGGLSRPAGDHISGPWIVHTDDIESTYAEVLHECHPLWITKTRLFEGKNYKNEKNGSRN